MRGIRVDLEARSARVEAGCRWGDVDHATHPYSLGGAYVNFLMEEGSDRIKDIYRDNYDRLVVIKTKYDPMNLFSRNRNIQPAA